MSWPRAKTGCSGWRAPARPTGPARQAAPARPTGPARQAAAIIRTRDGGQHSLHPGCWAYSIRSCTAGSPARRYWAWHEPEIVRGGMFRSFALAGGRAVGTWGLSGGQVSLSLLERVSPEYQRALEADAEDVRRFLGLGGPARS